MNTIKKLVMADNASLNKKFNILPQMMLLGWLFVKKKKKDAVVGTLIKELALKSSHNSFCL